MMESVGITKIDCNLEYSLCEIERVTETPSIRLYIDGVHSLDYSGVRTAASMYKFLFDNMEENLSLDGDLHRTEVSGSFIEIRDKRALASQQQSAPERPSCRLTGHLLVDQLPENVHIRTKSSVDNIGTVAKSEFTFRSKEYRGIVVDVEKVLEVYQDAGEDAELLDDDFNLYEEFEVEFDDAPEWEFDDAPEWEPEWDAKSDESYSWDPLDINEDERDSRSDEYYSGDPSDIGEETLPTEETLEERHSRDQGAKENPEEDEASIDLAKYKSFFGSNLRKNARTEMQ
jgi:hypothetical protein